MESPEIWTFLTGAIHVVGLDAPEHLWDFLVYSRAVGNRADVRKSFLQKVRATLEEGPITGPSIGLRIAGRMEMDAAVRGVTVIGRQPDPHGVRARQCYAEFLERAPDPVPCIAEPFDQLFCCRCGARTSITYPHVEQCQVCDKPPVNILSLLVQLGYSSTTYTTCPRCDTPSCFDPFCHYCGEAFSPQSLEQE